MPPLNDPLSHNRTATRADALPLGGVLALAGVLFFRMLGIFIVLPVIAVLALALEGASVWAVGIALGAYGATQALMQIPIGILADRFGRKPVLFVALALFTIGGFLAAAADSILGLIAGRLLQGAGAVAAVAAAWIADIVAPTQRTRAMALFGVAIAAAFVISLFVAPPLAGHIGLQGILNLTGWLGLISMALLIVLPPPPQTRAVAPPPILSLLALADLRRCAGGAFTLHYAMAAMFILLPTTLIAALPAPEHWRVYAGGFFLSLIPALPLLARADRWRRQTTMIAIAAVLIGCGAFLFADSAARGVAALFFFFAGFIVLEAALPALAAKAAPAAHRAAAMGIVMTSEFAGVFAGGAVTGFFQQTIGSKMSVGVIGALLIFWLIAEYRSDKFKR